MIKKHTFDKMKVSLVNKVSHLCFPTSQCSDASSAAFTKPALGRSAVSEQEQTTLSTNTVCRAEMDSEHHAELDDMVAAMNVAANRVTPPNGYRSGAPRGTSSHRGRLSDRKMSLQERGSRISRQPTIETKRVSITDADVSPS